MANLPNLLLKEQVKLGMTHEQVLAVMGERPFEEWRREGMSGYGLLYENVPLDIRLDDKHLVTVVFDQPIA